MVAVICENYVEEEVKEFEYSCTHECEVTRIMDTWQFEGRIELAIAARKVLVVDRTRL